MGIHGDDVLREIRHALAKTETAVTQGDVRCWPNPDRDGWRNRDGRLQFDCVGRDWFRGFRITVEVIEVDDADWDGEHPDEWTIMDADD